MSFETHLESVIRPAAKLHVAVLVVEGEPSDVDLAGGLEDAGRNVGAHTCLSVCQGAPIEKPLCTFVQCAHHLPSLVTITFVWYVPSNASSALK